MNPDLIHRRALLLGTSAAALLPPWCAREAQAQEPPLRTLRYAFRAAETSLDPAQIGDIYSRTLTAHIFEALYRYDHLARPPKLRPLTAAAMPEHSADFRVWTIRLQPGIFFADDPAFKGVRRELVADDYVYMLKRHADPANKSPTWPTIASTFEIAGLAALRDEAIAGRRPFDYGRELPGARALDRHTLRFTLDQPRPRFIENLAGSDLFGAVANEVVEHYGREIDAHPVGTGPFRLAQWVRASRIVFERNPGYRELRYDAEPAPDDAEGQALLARFKGRRLPMVDRVEVSVTGEEQPRWLAFAGGEVDFIERVAPEFIAAAMSGEQVAPHLAKRGVRGYVQAEPGTTMLIFNLENSVVGGYAPAQVALRRAIALAIDTPREIGLLLKGRALAAQSPIAPYTSGYDPALRSEMSEYNPTRAKALLDLYGYIDRGDGWRARPDGSPLRLELAAQSDQISRPLYEMLTKNLAAIGVRLHLKFADWTDNLKGARAGRFMVWTLSDAAASVPDGQGALARYDSRQIGGQNLARFRLPDFDALYDRMLQLPDGPEREALFLQAKRIAVAYMPYKLRSHRVLTDMAQRWLVGYRRPIFWQDWWQWVDIDHPQA